MAPKYSVNQILTLDELELVQLVKSNRDSEGNITLNVSGLGDISKTQRDQLANRLNAAAGQTSASGQSGLDFDQLNARLVGIAAERDTQPSQGGSPWWSGDERPRTLSPVPDAEEELETYAYNKLVEDGGRPAYPISSLGQVFEDPAAYHESLRPWLQPLYLDSTHPEHYRNIFGTQQHHWREFRRWQIHNRGMPDSEGFAEYLEERKRSDKIIGNVHMLADPAYEEDCRRYWEHKLSKWKWERANVREVYGNAGFSEYNVVASRRLADHGFTQHFRFDEDPKRQDEWTTFVEYLEFACWSVDRISRILQRLQKRYDAAWEQLQKAKVLKGIETEEDLSNTDYQRYIEKVQASRTIEAAQSSLISARQRQASHKDLDLAQKKLGVAEESLATISRRNDLVYRFWKDTNLYRDRRKERRMHEMRREWIRGQLSLIERDLSGPKPNGGKKRPVDDDAGEEQGRKKQKHDQGNEQGSGRRISWRTTRSKRVQPNSTAEVRQPFGREAVDTHTSTATKDPGMAHAQNPRRSARIAAAAEKARKVGVSVGGTTTPTPAEEPKKMQRKRKRQRASPAKLRKPLGSTQMTLAKRKGGSQQRLTRRMSNG